jgi:two-component system, LytTR family, response regulator
MTPLRTLIVDDEPLARRRVCSLLRAHAQIEIIGECGDGASAIAAIRAQAPELVFLDIRMPEVDGFGVIDAIGPARMPIVVFVTAYDRYALAAFDVCAVDYVLKPFDRERFARAVDRACARRGPDALAEVRGALRTLAERAASRPDAMLALRVAGRIVTLRHDEIDWIGAAGNFVEVHTAASVLRVHETLAAMERHLYAARFRRVHRAALVNLDRVRELRPAVHGDAEVVLHDGSRLALSRRYREALEIELAAIG